MSASLRDPIAPGPWSNPLVSGRAERIERSHLRCEAQGLARAGCPDLEPLTRAELALVRDRNRRLFAHAAPVMEMLFEQIVHTGCMIVLTDAQGTILHSVGDDEFLERADKVALAPGMNWAEATRGTNAIGTALIEERPALVHAAEHFLEANHFLTCSACPIFDPGGRVLGVLDVTGDQRSFHQHTMGLVRMSARMIENHWLGADGDHRLRLHFHSRPEFIGTLLEGIVTVGADGRLLGANRGALDLLELSGSTLRVHTLASLFGTSVAALHAHAHAAVCAPLPLAGAGGRQFHADVRFCGPARAVTAGRDVAVPLPVAARETPAPAGGLRALDTGDAQVGVVLEKVRRLLGKDIPLLVLGEKGTGKELLARALHEDSRRARRPFVVVNCAAVPEPLIEAELFGDGVGSFAGARRKCTVGLIAQASGGTLFLEEVADMPLGVQARLLRVLQERSLTPLGSQKAIALDIAVVSASRRDLREMVAAGRFREDLYDRLNGLAVRLPPLRERSDLRAIARRLLAAEVPLGTPAIGPTAMVLLESCRWPGNVRQLANVLRAAAAMAEEGAEITAAHLPEEFLEEVCLPADVEAAPPPVPVPEPAPAPCTLGETELVLIRQALEACGGNISRASRRLGISRNTIYRKLCWGR